METSEAIRTRRSTRAFLPQPVPREAIERVLEVSRWAPSGRNRQPWRVTVAAGTARDALVARILERARRAPCRDRHHAGRVARGASPLASACARCSRGLREAMGISLWEFLMGGSYGFYGAPVVVAISSVSSGHAGAEVAPFVTTLLVGRARPGPGHRLAGDTAGLSGDHPRGAEHPGGAQTGRGPGAGVCRSRLPGQRLSHRAGGGGIVYALGGIRRLKGT